LAPRLTPVTGKHEGVTANWIAGAASRSGCFDRGPGTGLLCPSCPTATPQLVQVHLLFAGNFDRDHLFLQFDSKTSAVLSFLLINILKHIFNRH
jgi:hypothetical protein